MVLQTPLKLVPVAGPHRVGTPCSLMPDYDPLVSPTLMPTMLVIVPLMLVLGTFVKWNTSFRHLPQFPWTRLPLGLRQQLWPFTASFDRETQRVPTLSPTRLVRMFMLKNGPVIAARSPVMTLASRLWLLMERTLLMVSPSGVVFLVPRCAELRFTPQRLETPRLMSFGVVSTPATLEKSLPTCPLPPLCSMLNELQCEHLGPSGPPPR